jgi:hypothetical protein
MPKRLEDEVQAAQLLQVIQQPAPDGGLWNGRKVADWMSELLERQVSPQRGWEYLKTMEYRLRMPRPENQHGFVHPESGQTKRVAATKS